MCPVAVWKAFSGSKVSSNSQGDSSFGIACLAVLKRKPWLQTRQCILWPSFVFFFILMAKENACLGKAFPSSVSWGYWRPFERESEAFSPQEVMVAFWPSGYWLATITRKKMKGSLTNKWKKETTVRPYKTARSVPVFHYVRTCFSSSFIYCWWGTSFHSLWKRRWNQRKPSIKNPWFLPQQLMDIGFNLWFHCLLLPQWGPLFIRNFFKRPSEGDGGLNN